jgi:hypothetical protein
VPQNLVKLGQLPMMERGVLKPNSQNKAFPDTCGKASRDGVYLMVEGMHMQCWLEHMRKFSRQKELKGYSV